MAIIILSLIILANALSVPGLRAFATIWQWQGRSHSAFVEKWKAAIPRKATVAAPPQCYYAALANDNIYRYNRIIGVGSECYLDYRDRMIRDNVQYLVVEKDRTLLSYLRPEDIHLFQQVGTIRQPIRKLKGITIPPNTYNLNIYRRKEEK